MLIQLKSCFKNIMAEGGDFGYDDPSLDHAIDHDDDEDTQPLLTNKTGSFTTSTPAYQTCVREELQMKEMRRRHFGGPETSYEETPFCGTEKLEKRLAKLRRDAITGMLNTTAIPDVINPLPFDQQQEEIQRVRDFIKKRYPNADISKLVISFSSKKPMDIVIKGPRGGETRIIKDNGSDFQKSFLNLTYVKRALGESYEEFAKKQEQRIYEERKMLADVVRKSPEKREIIDSLKEKNLKKRNRKKKEKERKFYETKQTEEIKEREEQIKKQNEADQKVLNDENAFP